LQLSEFYFSTILFDSILYTVGMQIIPRNVHSPPGRNGQAAQQNVTWEIDVECAIVDRRRIAADQMKT